MPSHGGPHNASQQLLEQYPRRTERARELRDYCDDLDEHPGEGDQCVDADVEERVCLCGWPFASEACNNGLDVGVGARVGIIAERVGV